MKTIYALTLILCSSITLSVHSQDIDNPKEGIDTLTTINSFLAFGEFYCMDYTGDYSALLDDMDDQMTRGETDPFKCSLFSANGDPSNELLGRNFDNPQNDVLLTRYSPPDANASLAFTRMNDLGFVYGTNYDELTFDQKLPLLLSAYFVPDGINEHGLSAGLAYIDPINYPVDPTKDTIFVTRLIREILDHAATVEEAVNIANTYNVFDNSVNTLSHHVLVGTPGQESVVIEYNSGEFQAVYSDTDWQVVTNTPVYNVPHQQLMNSCWRYNALYTILEEHDGILPWQQGMDVLDQVHLNCPWSAIYDMTNRAMYIAVHNNYNDITWVNLEEFNFLMVDISELPVDQTKTKLLISSPNPFSELTTITYTLTEKQAVELSIYDLSGQKIKTLLKEEINAGHYSINWNGQNEKGEKVQPGVYICQMRYNKQSKTIRLIHTNTNN